MQTMDFKIPLLEEVVTSYRFDFPATQIQDLIEVVRILDILGAEVRYKEYGLLLYVKLVIELEMEDWLLYADRIPVSFEELAHNYRKVPFSFKNNFQLHENAYALGSKHLVSHIIKSSPMDKTVVFLKLCNNGHFELAFELDSDLQIRNTLNIHDHRTFFQAACKYGQLSVAQEVYAGGGRIDHFRGDSAFLEACKYGHLDVCQWLYSLGRFDIHVSYDCAFANACGGGHLSIAQWLLSLEPIDHFQFHQISMNIFSGAFHHKHIESWLYESKLIELFPLTPLFQMICQRGNLSSAQQLYQSYPSSISIHDLQDKAFALACSSGNIELVQWLYGRGEVHIQHCDDRYIFDACGRHFELAKWMYSIDEGFFRTNRAKVFE
jgi:hypothetical protein